MFSVAPRRNGRQAHATVNAHQNVVELVRGDGGDVPDTRYVMDLLQLRLQSALLRDATIAPRARDPVPRALRTMNALSMICA